MTAVSPRRATSSPEDEEAILDAVGKWLERDVRAHVRALA